VNLRDLVETFPRLYHVAVAGSWPSISRLGLLSTTALLDRFEIVGDQRRALESTRRPASVTISHPTHGQALIRDQIPIREAVLARRLEGMSVDEWLRELNRRVFFWLDDARVLRLLSAVAYRHHRHDVLVVDTASLLAAHEERVTLSPINTGSTIYNAAPRGVGTFLRIADYPFEDWGRRRGRRRAIAELAVEYSVPDIAVHTLTVESRKGSGVLGTMWHRERTSRSTI
jgi:hypothetical protein